MGWAGKGLGLAFCAALSILASRAGAAEPAVAAWSLVNVPPMQTARAVHQAVVLKDGRVFICGGCAAAGCESVQSSTELYDPATRTFRTGSPMITRRVSHAAVLLADGRVFVAGGWTGVRATSDAEIYDPAKDRFRTVELMTQPRIGPTAVLLGNGRVLLAGGEADLGTSLATMEIFDPAKGRFTKAGMMIAPRTSHTATVLRDGRVLIVGGQRGRDAALSSAEIFDPVQGVSRPTGGLSVPRLKHAAVLLADGRVLIVGGSSTNVQAQDTTEIYDPATRRFSMGPTMSAVRYKIPDAVAVLPTGTVVVAGGASRAEHWSPGEPGFTSWPDATSEGSMAFATATALRNGGVLVLGGYNERTQPSSAAILLVGQQ
jgi:hypothetical protein